MNILKYALIFASGAIVGGGISALFMKKKYEKIYREMADDELAQMDEYYQSLLSGDEDFEAEEDEEFEEVEKGAPHEHQKRQGSFATDYASYYGGRADPAETEHPQEEESEVREKINPKLIKASQFGSNGYSQRVLYYYTDDDDLTPEGDNFGDIIDCDEVKDMIGNALIKYGFADEGNLERDIYVRNFDRKTDYRIIKVIGSLSDEDNGG